MLAVLVERSDLLLSEAVWTATGIMIVGLLLGLALGATLAIIFAASAGWRRWALPLLCRQPGDPRFALAPLLVLWLGYGMASKVAMAALIIYFPVTAAFFDGLRRTEPGWIELARTMNASPGPSCARSALPAALPALASGAARRRRRRADRRRGRRMGRRQRRARLPDAARQGPYAGRPLFAALLVLAGIGLGLCSQSTAAAGLLPIGSRKASLPASPEIADDRCPRPRWSVALVAASVPARAADKLTVMLDWFVNPDHAQLMSPARSGFFAEQGLEVELVAPADPNDPPKLVAAGQADIAVLLPAAASSPGGARACRSRASAPGRRPSTAWWPSADGPMSIGDLKGRKVGYSVGGFEDALLGAMLERHGLELADVSLVNVNFSLSPALIAGQVDAVIGAFRNFELNQMQTLDGRAAPSSPRRRACRPMTS